MAITDEFFNRSYLYPSEIARGIKLGWKPDYTVLVSGDDWIEAHDWLVGNTSGLWMDHIFQPEYLVGFEKAEDAMAFKLRWI